MKDKILLPAVVATLVLLVIFMLMNVVNQSLLTRELSEKSEALSKSLKDTQAAVIRLQSKLVSLERKMGVSPTDK